MDAEIGKRQMHRCTENAAKPFAFQSSSLPLTHTHTHTHTSTLPRAQRHRVSTANLSLCLSLHSPQTAQTEIVSCASTFLSRSFQVSMDLISNSFSFTSRCAIPAINICLPHKQAQDQYTTLKLFKQIIHSNLSGTSFSRFFRRHLFNAEVKSIN